MWKVNCIIGLLALFCAFHRAEGTTCYQCDSWEHPECNEDDYIDDKYLTPCSFQYQITPTTCLKEVTTFLPGQILGQLDRYNRFGRPHVMRRCGISLTAGSTSYRQGDYYDGCTEAGGEVIVNGIQGTRLTCTCLTDGCNSALPSGMINIATLFSAVTSAFVFSQLF